MKGAEWDADAAMGRTRRGRRGEEGLGGETGTMRGWRHVRFDAQC